MHVLMMPKPRRKFEIRAAALREVAALRELAEARAAFLKPRPRSWHDLFLAALRDGQSVSAAARAAGVARSTVHNARLHEPGFDAAWRSAYAQGLALRRRLSTQRQLATARRRTDEPRDSVNMVHRKWTGSPPRPERFASR